MGIFSKTLNTLQALVYIKWSRNVHLKVYNWPRVAHIFNFAWLSPKFNKRWLSLKVESTVSLSRNLKINIGACMQHKGNQV